MLDIPPPTLNLEAIEAGLLAAGGIIAGAFLLLWGRHAHRAFSAILCAGVAVVAAAPAVQRASGIDLRLVEAVMAVSAAIVGAVAARVLWALLAGAFFASLAGGAVLWSLPLGIVGWRAELIASGGSFVSWSWAAMKLLGSAAQAAWSQHPVVLVLATAPAGVIPLIVAFVRPRAAALFGTAVCGAKLMVAGGLMAAEEFRSSLWASAWAHPCVPAAVMGGLLLVGVVFQYRSLRAEERRKKASKGGPAKPAGAEG
jgi:hypothetical protein